MPRGELNRHAWLSAAVTELKGGRSRGAHAVKPLYLFVRPALDILGDRKSAPTKGSGPASKRVWLGDVRLSQIHPATIVIDLRRIGDFVEQWFPQRPW